MSDNANLSVKDLCLEPRRFRAERMLVCAATPMPHPMQTDPERRRAPAAIPATLTRMPGWARKLSHSDQGVDPGFLAGAALACLDPMARDGAAWVGCWRQRLALRCAVVAAHSGRPVDEASLRDAWHLTRASADVGPAARAYGAWRDLARFSPPPPTNAADAASQDRLIRASMDLGFDPALVTGLAPDALSRSPVGAAAAAAEAVAGRDRRAEPLGLWLADRVLAQRLGWPIPIPLLAIGITRGRDGRRPRPGDDNWASAVEIAYARAAARAVDLGNELARRADALAAAVPKLRAKGAGSAVSALLEDDAVAGTATLAGLSDRAGRRLFDRLAALRVVRELSGRSTFRLYGL